MAEISGPLLDLKKRTTPTEFAQALRRAGPVFWSEADQFWVVTDYTLAGTVLKSGDFSADRSGFFMAKLSRCPFHKISSFLGVVKKMMVTSDPPEHSARRKLAAFGIADHVLDDFAPAVERTVDELLDRVADRSEFDFSSEVAQWLPVTVLADLFCIPESKRQDFYVWSNHMTQMFGGGDDLTEDAASLANESAANLRDYFNDLIQARRARPSNDFLSHLIGNQASLGLDDSEVVSQAIMMLVAGQVTTTDQMCNNLLALLENPDVLEQVRRDGARLDALIEEVTRLDPAVNFVFRVAKQESRLGASVIKAGQLVFVSNHAVNRDPEIFERPDEIRLDRTKNPHFSYGHGIHFCLGARLARIQMNRLFGRLIARFPTIALSATKPSRRKHQSLAFSGFETLMVSSQ